MSGLFTIARKELLDIVTEKKFILIFATLLIVVLVSSFQGAQQFMKGGFYSYTSSTEENKTGPDFQSSFGIQISGKMGSQEDSQGK